MTVNELLQKLVELARDGKGQWPLAVQEYNYQDLWDIKEDGLRTLVEVNVNNSNNEVVLA